MAITIAPLRSHHIPQVLAVLERCFPDMPPSDQYDAGELEELIDIFPESVLLALDDDTVAGFAVGTFVDLDFDNLPPTEQAVLYDEDDASTHTMDGAYYYGSDIGVDPAYQGRGIGRKLYDARKALVRRYNKKGFVAAGVLPGYADHRDQMDIQAYVNKVIAGELRDATLSVQLRNGFEVRGLLKDFYIFPRSDNWSTLIVWDNVDYEE